MIADAPITSPQADQGGRPTLPWVSWFVQLAAALNGLLNAFTVGSANAVTIANPAGLQFGTAAGYTPVITMNVGGAVSSSSIAWASFLRVGQMTHLQLEMNVVLSAASSIIYISLPVNAVGMAFNPLCCVINIGGWNAGIAMTQVNVIPVMLYNQAAFPVGSNIRIIINGLYRCA